MDHIEIIGVASPGNIKQNRIYHVVNLGIEKLDIVSLIQKHFSCPVKVKNDAKCAGIAEMKYGSMKEYQDGIFLCMGTGIGGAAFMQKTLLEPQINTGMEFRTYGNRKRWKTM